MINKIGYLKTENSKRWTKFKSAYFWLFNQNFISVVAESGFKTLFDSPRRPSLLASHGKPLKTGDTICV